MKLNRDEFLETGYLIVKEAVPRDKLDRVRQAYETLVNRQRENWKAERAAGDPLGGVWETGAQPRLQLSRAPLVNQIDPETAPAVEVWLEENIHGVSTELLGIADGAVTEMMMMCNPVRDHGPARWHRDLHPIDTAPLQGYIDDIVEGGPRYVQWNIPLYDDSVLWVVPGSHLRLNTPEENEVMLADPPPPAAHWHADPSRSRGRRRLYPPDSPLGQQLQPQDAANRSRWLLDLYFDRRPFVC